MPVRQHLVMTIKPLSPQQRVAMQLMLNGHSKGQVVEKIGISQPTLARWIKLPMWQQELQEAVKLEQGQGESQMRTLVPQATQVVNQLLVAGSDQVRLGAARLVFETVDRMTQREEQSQVLVELEGRLEDLQVIAQQQGLMAKPLPMVEPAIETEAVE